MEEFRDKLVDELTCAVDSFLEESRGVLNFSNQSDEEFAREILKELERRDLPTTYVFERQSNEDYFTIFVEGCDDRDINILDKLELEDKMACISTSELVLELVERKVNPDYRTNPVAPTEDILHVIAMLTTYAVDPRPDTLGKILTVLLKP